MGAVGEANVRILEVRRARLTESWPLNDVVRSGDPLFFTSREAFLARYPKLAEYLVGSRATAAAFLPLIAQGGRSARWRSSTRASGPSPVRTAPC